MNNSKQNNVIDHKNFDRLLYRGYLQWIKIMKARLLE